MIIVKNKYFILIKYKARKKIKKVDVNNMNNAIFFALFLPKRIGNVLCFFKFFKNNNLDLVVSLKSVSLSLKTVRCNISLFSGIV